MATPKGKEESSSISTYIVGVLVSLGPHFLECEDASDRVKIEQIRVRRLLNDPVGNDIL